MEPGNVALFGNEVFADVIRVYVKMSYLGGWGWEAPYKRRQTQSRRGQGHVQTEAETEVMWPQAQD